MLGRKGSLLLSVVVLIAGCGGPPRLDTSSEESAVASLKRVRESLPEDVRPAFDEAVTTVALDRVGASGAAEMAGGPPALGARLLRPLNGMTAAEVLTEARRIRADARAMQGAAEGEPATPR